MSRETTIIGEREFAYSKIAAFEANSILLKLQKIVLPVFGEIAGDGKKNIDILDMDMNNVFTIISSKLDDSVMTDIVLPMFKLAQVASVTDNVKIDSNVNINRVFVDADGLSDLYLLIFEVLKYNFSGFFTKLMGNFGNRNGDQKAIT